MAQRVRDILSTPENSHNFNVVPASKTTVGTTLENLKAAVMGETGASAKYLAYAQAAEEQGFSQFARLFRATSAAEQIHIAMEKKLVLAEEPDYVAPTAGDCETYTCDINLIEAAEGEIYETSDMYPSFIKKAQEEGREDAVKVFTRAKLAESVHAQRYLEAYNDMNLEDDGAKYYVCPVCGYIHRGEDFEKCPICFAPKKSFREF